MRTGGDLAHSVVQVLDRQGQPAGTGFLVGDQLLVTCAHVVPGGGGPVSVRFAPLDDQPRRAWVVPEHWREPGAGDVAFLWVADPLPALARPLPLGAARDARRHPVQTYGFPVNAPGSGHYGYGVVGDLIRSDRGHRLLALEGLRRAPSREAWGSLGTLLSRPVVVSQVRYGHTGRVVDAEFGPDGELVTLDRQGQLRRWRAGAGQAVRVREPPGAEGGGLPPFGQSLAVSPDGRWLATSDDSGGIWLWDAATSRPVHQFINEPTLNGGVRFSQDGELLAGIVGGGVRLWHTGSREPAGAQLELRSGILSRLAFRPDGGALAIASEQGIVEVRELPSRRTLARFRIEQGAYALAFSPDGELLAVGGEAGVVYLVASEEAVGEPIQVTGRVRDLAFRPDGEVLVTADSEGVVQQWDLASRDPVGPPLLGHAGRAETVAFSPDGGMLATGGFDTSVRLWRVDTGEQLGPPLVPPGGEVLDPNETVSGDPVVRVTFTADGSRVLAQSTDAVRVWDATGGDSGPTVLDLDPDSLEAVAFSPDGSRIATATEDQTARLWDAAGEPVAGPFRLGFRPGSLAVSPDGERLAAAGFPGRSRCGIPGPASSWPPASWASSSRVSPRWRSARTAVPWPPRTVWSSRTRTCGGGPDQS